MISRCALYGSRVHSKSKQARAHLSRQPGESHTSPQCKLRRNRGGSSQQVPSATDVPAFTTHNISVTVELSFSASASGVMSVIWLSLRLRGERNARRDRNHSPRGRRLDGETVSAPTPAPDSGLIGLKHDPSRREPERSSQKVPQCNRRAGIQVSHYPCHRGVELERVGQRRDVRYLVVAEAARRKERPTRWKPQSPGLQVGWQDGQRTDTSPRCRVVLEHDSSRAEPEGSSQKVPSATDVPAFRTH